MWSRSSAASLLTILGLSACTPATDAPDVDTSGFAAARTLGWSGRAPLAAGVRAAAIAATATRIYLIAGNAGFSTLTDLNRIYNPATNTWSAGAPLPAPRDFGMAAALTDGIHFVGGVGPSGLAPDHWVYNTGTDTWTARAPLPLLVDAAVSRVVNNRLYIIGGGSANGPTGAVQIYDPTTDTWSTGAPMPTPRLSAASGAAGRRILVAGGQTANVGTTDVLESYDTHLNRWGRLTPLPPGPREALGGGIVAGQLCVFGGRLAQGNPTGAAFPETFCFSLTTRAWSQAANMLTPRAEIASIEFGDRVYAMGGRDAANIALTTNEVLR